MFRIYHSNRLENLFDRFAHCLSVPAADPFARETVVVQSQGMARWLSLELARQHGVSANIDFPFPASFIGGQIRQVLATDGNKSAFDSTPLKWAVWEQLQGLGDEQVFRELQSYLGRDDSSTRSWQLAGGIAGVFDQYMVYRPDWLKGWSEGKDDNWQAVLWRRLLGEHGSCSRVDEYFQFRQFLGHDPHTDLKRVFLFGIPVLPKPLFDAFADLSRLIDVHLFLLNPCRDYWDELVDYQRILDESLGSDGLDPVRDLHFDHGHPLLVGLGRLGQDFQRMIHSFEVEEEALFEDPAEASLLCALQRSILDNCSPEDCSFELAGVDCSIQLHAAHNAMREVEILHDQVLAVFADDPAMSPADILVMVPDINLYAPLVEAVFSRTVDTLPYAVADRNVGSVNVAGQAFLHLLELVSDRLPVTEFLAFLDYAPVMENFGLGVDDLEQIDHWLLNTDIHWGIDAGHRLDLGLPGTSRGSWQAGLDQLLLGYAMGAGDDFVQGILPFDKVEGQQGELLGCFLTLMRGVFNFARDCRQDHPMDWWQERLNDVLDFFFAPSFANELQELRDVINKSASDSSLAGCHRPLSLIFVKSVLAADLETNRGQGGFLDGRLTFCQMMPMRSIPFKVICLLGMSEGVFPRVDRPLDFDLMAGNRRQGDRSRRDDDRYLFLETILSAREKLYLSYVGMEPDDNKLAQPSLVVCDLLNSLADLCAIPLAKLQKHLLVAHPLQPFSPRYFQGEKELFSFSSIHHQTAVKCRQHQAYKGITLTGSVDEIRTITLDDLINFLAHPGRWFCRQQAGIFFRRDRDMVSDRECFSLSGLDRYTLIDRELNQGISGSGFDALQARGDLPSGRSGYYEYLDINAVARGISSRLLELQQGPALSPYLFDLEFGNIRLTGNLHRWPGGQFLVRPGKCKGHNARDYIRHFLHHLVLLSVFGEDAGPTYYLRGDGGFSYENLTSPGDYLAELIKLFLAGQTRPLCLLPKASLAYAKAMWKSNKLSSDEQPRAWRQAEKIWFEGAFNNDPERDDPYLRAVFGDGFPGEQGAFAQVAETVFKDAIMRQVTVK